MSTTIKSFPSPAVPMQSVPTHSPYSPLSSPHQVKPNSFLDGLPSVHVSVSVSSTLPSFDGHFDKDDQFCFIYYDPGVDESEVGSFDNPGACSCPTP